jgi:hypothetical protein
VPSLSYSWINAALTTHGEAAMYSRRGNEGSGLARVAKSDRCCLSNSKDVACSGPQAKFFMPRNVLRKGRLRSADLEMNLFKAANLPVNRWTSLADYEGVMLMIAWIFVGLASIPRCNTRYPSIFPWRTPKAHFSGLSRRRASRILANVSARSARWSSLFLLANDVVHVGENVAAYLTFEHPLGEARKG